MTVTGRMECDGPDASEAWVDGQLYPCCGVSATVGAHLRSCPLINPAADVSVVHPTAAGPHTPAAASATRCAVIDPPAGVTPRPPAGAVRPTAWETGQDIDARIDMAAEWFPQHTNPRK